MKKQFYTFAVILFTALTFWSCSDDDDVEDSLVGS